MITPPTGIVTFLFTEIENSTLLAQEHSKIYQTVLEKHDKILTDTIEINNGFIFKKVGDAFCICFNNEEDAVNASIEIQKRITAEDNGKVKIKVRIGIHKGEAEYINRDYMGYVTLSRSQRIMSVANGEQILITKEIYNSLTNSNSLYSFRDLGKRILKNIILPEHIYQILAEGIPSDFPPLNILDARQNNLPSQLTNFIGRKKEIEDIKKLFPDTRMLTLTGTGGTGKTRLALQIASEFLDEFENGVWIIELSPITDPELIVKEISNVLNLKENPGTDNLELLKEFLKDKKILLIFDNSEHLLSRCSPLAEALLTFCAGLKIISTSREAFNISGEIIYRVPPLSLPVNIKIETAETLMEFESVKFFLDRAVSVNSNFKLTNENIYIVAELCKKLDGIPLAIELASKRVTILTVEKIYDRLTDRFKLLTGGNSTALPRQKTLRALIDWSYDLLNFNEQLLLQRLSVFQGGWSLEAAEQICCDESIDDIDLLDLMNSLLDKSLINFIEENGKTRYGMLETIKVYSMEKLTDKLNDYQKHIDYYLKLTDYDFNIQNGTGQIEWLRIIKSEIDNIRICIQRALDFKLNEAALIAINMHDFWSKKGYFSEGFETLLKVLESLHAEDKMTEAKLKEKLAGMCYYEGKFELLEKYSTEALNYFKESGNIKGIVECLNLISVKYYIEGKEKEVVKILEEALILCEEINSDSLKANILINLAGSIQILGDRQRAIALKEESLLLHRKDNNESSVAIGLLSLSVSELKINKDIKKAIQYSEESITISRLIEDNYPISLNLIHLGSIMLLYEKNYLQAEYLLQEGYRTAKNFGYTMNLYPVRIFLGILYTENNETEKSFGFYEEYLTDRLNSGFEYFIKDVFTGISNIKLKEKQYIKASVFSGIVNQLSDKSKFKSLSSKISINKDDLDLMKENFSEEEYLKNFEIGKSMSLDEAIQFALA